jgi:hypothetical protein
VNRAELHLALARKYADWMLAPRPELPDDIRQLDVIQLATVHYLGFLAEMKWSETPRSDWTNI